MRGYKQVEAVVEVPKDAGVEGFLKVLRNLLRLPRIQNVNIDARGKVLYTYFVREDEENKALAINFEDAMPYAIIRNGEVKEIPYAHENAAIAVAQMFQRLAVDHLVPVAFVSGTKTWFWRWYKETTGISGSIEDELFGLPILSDRMLDDASLVICGAFGRESSFIDTIRSYKITIPKELNR